MASDNTPVTLTLTTIMRQYSTEAAARAYFEQIRWPNGPVCPHCGNADQARIYKVTANQAKKIRPGQYKCADCRRSFTVTVGTVMEDTRIPLVKWLLGFYIMAASKTQVSALQLQRQLDLGSYKTAWFMCHRIRYALLVEEPEDLLTGTVEADETYIGPRATNADRLTNKIIVVSLVERDGRVRSHVVDRVNGDEITRLLDQHVDRRAHLNSDESPMYRFAGRRYASHDTSNHDREEYSRWDPETGRRVSTNTVEGFFGNAKRGIDGTHHSISRQHADLYFAEVDAKYNERKASDGVRTAAFIAQIEGKRLTFKGPDRYESFPQAE